MAKLQGPLLSFSAAGTVAGLLTFRTINGRPTVQRAPQVSPPPSPNQIDIRARGTNAARQWRALTPAQRDEWRPIATQRALPMFAAYLSEFIRQHCDDYTPPRIPATFP